MRSEICSQYLRVMGIQEWVLRTREVETPPAEVGCAVRTETVAPDEVGCAVRTETTPPIPQEPNVALDWTTLQTGVSACTLCELHKTRTQTVFGVGNRNADWMIIGEAPGADEDRQGEPFVGRAGQLLNAMLKAVGLQRPQVFIANILKCRPPRNRDPLPHEVEACEPYLARQIELLQPKLILAVGRIAAQNLLRTETSIGRLRGKIHSFGPQRISLVVTYHPAYLLRSPREKRKAWEDLQLACSVTQGKESNSEGETL